MSSAPKHTSVIATGQPNTIGHRGAMAYLSLFAFLCVFGRLLAPVYPSAPRMDQAHFAVTVLGLYVFPFIIPILVLVFFMLERQELKGVDLICCLFLSLLCLFCTLILLWAALSHPLKLGGTPNPPGPGEPYRNLPFLSSLPQLITYPPEYDRGYGFPNVINRFIFVAEGILYSLISLIAYQSVDTAKKK